MNFLRENEVDFECSFDGNDDGELQSTLDCFIQKVSNGLQRPRKRGKFPCSLVNNMSKQTSKKKTIKFWVLGRTKSQRSKMFSFLFNVKRYDMPWKGINWMEILSVHFFTSVLSKTAKTFVSQKIGCGIGGMKGNNKTYYLVNITFLEVRSCSNCRRDEREQWNEVVVQTE